MSVNLNNLIVFRNLLEDELINSLCVPKKMQSELTCMMLAKAEKLGLTGIVPVEYSFYAIAHERNTFLDMAEKFGNGTGRSLKKAVEHDILILRVFIQEIFNRYKNDPLLGNYVPTKIQFLCGRNRFERIFMHGSTLMTTADAVEDLCDYYAKYGYGLMLDYAAFSWEGGEQKLLGTRNFSDITFDKIYGYERQKKELIGNTEAFLAGRPANNVLLYGDRGTGKSSCVQALGNMFFSRGLRLVEVSRQYFEQLPKVMAALSKWGKYFIVVLDDLSFEEFEVEYKSLKSILEGGLEVKPANVLFYATSNRRNLVKEVWQDQDARELHNVDSINEKISLADRFGIKLYFDSMDQDAYFYMLTQTAANEKLPISEDDLKAEAVKWEMSHTGRNGRVGRQLLDYLHGRLDGLETAEAPTKK